MQVPQVFGWQHLLYLTISILVLGAAIILIKKYVKDPKQLSNLIRVFGLLLFASILWNRISICLYWDGWQEQSTLWVFDERWRKLLPDSFCGTSSLALSLIAIFGRRDNKALHCVAYVALLGGVLTLVYPDFIVQDVSLLFPKTISGLLHHTLSVFIVLLMLATGYLVPKINKWHYLPLGLCCYITYGLFLVTIGFSGNPMYFYSDILEGTGLNWLTIGLLFLSLHAICLLLWEAARKIYSKSKLTIS